LEIFVVFLVVFVVVDDDDDVVVDDDDDDDVDDVGYINLIFKTRMRFIVWIFFKG
jgi:hypothetical protein